MDKSAITSVAELASFLRTEHELLGAQFEFFEELESELPIAYAGVDETAALRTDIGLIDLSGMSVTLIAGPVAQAFIEMVCAGRRLAVGEALFEPVLAGDASLISIPLLLRTGDSEYLLCDVSSRASLLDAWLHFIATAQQNDSAPFKEIQLEDASFKLVPLLLAGPGANSVLSDYLTGEVPTTGQVRSLELDKIRCLVTSLPKPFDKAYLVMVPPHYVRVLWRSFLSFTRVHPVGRTALFAQAEQMTPWVSWLHSTERIKKSARELQTLNLLRQESDFIGARALD